MNQTFQSKIKDKIQGQADNMKKLGDKISGVFSAIPGGATISKFLGLDTLGDDLEKNVVKSLDDVEEGSTAFTAGLGGVFNGLTAGLNRLKVAFISNPILMGAAAIIAIVTAVMQFRKAARDTANELEISAQAAREMTFELKIRETR